MPPRRSATPQSAADYRHDEWGVDVTVSGSQKGLMLPPGISFNALSPRAIEASRAARLPKSFWAWDEMLAFNANGYFPYTPNTNLLYGLHEAIAMIEGEGLTAVFARHQRLARACRCAVEAWGLETQCADPAAHSPVLTGVVMPEGIDADAVRRDIHQRFDTSLGAGLGKLKGGMFRIGHLGDCNDVTLLATLCAVEMGLARAGVGLAASGVVAGVRRPECTAGLLVGHHLAHLSAAARPGLEPFVARHADRWRGPLHLDWHGRLHGRICVGPSSVLSIRLCRGAVSEPGMDGQPQRHGGGFCA